MSTSLFATIAIAAAPPCARLIFDFTCSAMPSVASVFSKSGIIFSMAALMPPGAPSVTSSAAAPGARHRLRAMTAVGRKYFMDQTFVDRTHLDIDKPERQRDFPYGVFGNVGGDPSRL